MQADYSGFARAAEIQAQSMANLGEQIGSAVTKYAVNKQKKEDKKLRYESILPYTTGMFGAEEGEKMARTFSNDAKLGAQILEFAGMQRDQAALRDALASSTTPEGDIDWSSVPLAYTELGGRDLKGVVGLIEKARGPGEVIVDPETGVVKQGGLYKGITRVPKTGDAKPPAGVELKQYDYKQLEEAMQAYQQGDDAKVNRIFLHLGYIDRVTGQPLNPLDIFGPRESLPEYKVPSLQDSDQGEQPQTSLDDIVSKYQYPQQ